MRTVLSVLTWLICFMILSGCSTPRPAQPIQPASPAPSLQAVGPTGVEQTAPPAATERPASSQAATTPNPMLAAPALPATAPPPVLRQLTSGGCCVQPFWSADGQQVLFIDKPLPDAPAGLWSVGLQGALPQFASDRLGIWSNDQQLRAFPEAGQTVVERLSDGQRWVIPSGGRAVSFSPDSQQLAWTTGQGAAGSPSVPRQIWVSQVDGSQARQVLTLPGGSFSGWLPDGRLLLTGRLAAPETGQALYALTLPANEAGQPLLSELGRGERVRGTAISPDGSWLAYLVTLSADPTQDGVWLVNIQSGEKRRLELFGAYRWRDGGRLLVVPLDLEQPVHRLWQVDAASGQAAPLTDPAVTPFKIANGDWSVSPDGQSIVFVSAADQNIWLLELPED